MDKYNKQQKKQTNASEEEESNGVVQPKTDIFFTSCKPRLGRRYQMELEYLFHNRTYSELHCLECINLPEEREWVSESLPPGLKRSPMISVMTF